MRDDLFTPASALDAAQRRLEQALDALAARVQAVNAVDPAAADASDQRDRRRLEGELLAARSREQQLEEVAAEASAALGRAAAEVRAALAAEA